MCEYSVDVQRARVRQTCWHSELQIRVVSRVNGLVPGERERGERQRGTTCVSDWVSEYRSEGGIFWKVGAGRVNIVRTVLLLTIFYVKVLSVILKLSLAWKCVKRFLGGGELYIEKVWMKMLMFLVYKKGLTRWNTWSYGLLYSPCTGFAVNM